MKATGPKARQANSQKEKKQRGEKKTKPKQYKEIRNERKEKTLTNCHFLTFSDCEGGGSGAEAEAPGVGGSKLPMASGQVAKYPSIRVARSCRLTMCVRKGFKKCRIPEAAVQSVELKNERTDRGRRLDGIRIRIGDGVSGGSGGSPAISSRGEPALTRKLRGHCGGMRLELAAAA